MPASKTMEILVLLRDKAGKHLKEIGNQTSKLAKRIKVTDRAFVAFRRTLNGLKSSIFSLKGAIAGVGVGLLARSFVKAASTAEGYQVRLKVILGSQKKANELFQDMAEFASSVSFEYEEIMGAATNLAGVMEGGVEEVKTYMPLIADLAATTGLGIQDATSQIIRMYSAGAASADMFRERGVLAC